MGVRDGLVLLVRPPRELPMARRRPPFAPAAERCASRWVLSIDTAAVMPAEPVSASNMANQMPCRLQRLKRLKIVVKAP